MFQIDSSANRCVVCCVLCVVCVVCCVVCGVQVYLADYGLSYRYCPGGIHKAYAEAPKKGHNGTVEYTSLDAHRGVGESMLTHTFHISTGHGEK